MNVEHICSLQLRPSAHVSRYLRRRQHISVGPGWAGYRLDKPRARRQAASNFNAEAAGNPAP
ncbi:HoxC4 [Roseibium sp. TrichSKD4]|nr:HoxC4 [Roseibium sp. TrichSKD4]